MKYFLSDNAHNNLVFLGACREQEPADVLEDLVQAAYDKLRGELAYAKLVKKTVDAISAKYPLKEHNLGGYPDGSTYLHVTPVGYKEWDGELEREIDLIAINVAGLDGPIRPINIMVETDES